MICVRKPIGLPSLWFRDPTGELSLIAIEQLSISWVGSPSTSERRQEIRRAGYYGGWLRLVVVILIILMERATVECRTISDTENEKPGIKRALRVSLFLLLTLRMSVLAMLVCSLRVLFGACSRALSFGVVALALMFGGETMCLS